MERHFAEIRMDFYNDQTNKTSIDAWHTDDDNEEGRVLGWYNHTTNSIEWSNDITEEEKSDPYLAETINDFTQSLENE